MKYTYLLFAAILFTGCINKSSINFTGVISGVKSGVFIIKTTGDSTIIGENIKDGKFIIPKRLLKQPDYYSMNITDDSNNDNHDPFEIYLEGGSYTIETEPGKLYKYPKITSSSKIQQQLSAFYTLADKLSIGGQIEVKRLNDEVKNKSNGLSPVAYSQLLNKLSAAEAAMTSNSVTAFKAFVKQYPNSNITAHLMAKLNYEDDPVSYYAIYQTLTPEAKNSDEGKEVGEKLSHLVKLVPGAKAPALAGNTPDGKPFDASSVTQKIILLDFWRASNQFSRQNHQKLLELLGQGMGKKLGIVSISLDTKADWWKTAVKDDHMTWPQVSDLKGDDSPNAVNWSISSLPTYYLVDHHWNIIESNIDIVRIDKEVSDYFALHPNQ